MEMMFARMQFEDQFDHPALPPPGHYGTGGFSSLDSFFPTRTPGTNAGQDDDTELQRILALSAATNREERLQEEFIRSTAVHLPSADIPPPPRPAPPPASGGEDDDAAFMEAAIMASLEQAQPAADDEDDPLLAQAGRRLGASSKQVVRALH
jgi:hypothetical protein